MFYIHVNGQTIKNNKRNGTNIPPIRYQKGKYGKPISCHRLKFDGGEILYDPQGKTFTKCGARLVIMTENEPQVIE